MAVSDRTFMTSTSRVALFATMVGAAIVANPSYAQGSSDDEVGADSNVNTIIVTAQKRAQDVQDVPVAINVLDDAALENYDVKNFEDVSRVSPALSIETGEEPSSNVIRMRGIGTAAFSVSAESAVAVIVDEVPLIVTAQAFGNLSDIERVEVLKGPQGTLFGKNASAGVVNIVTKDPTSYFSGSVALRATTDEEFKGAVSISGPISDTLKFRLNGYALDREGYIKNLVDGRKFAGEEAYGVRGKLLWEPTSNFDAAVIVDISRRDSSGASPFIALPLNEPNRNLIVATPENLDVQLDTPNNFETKNELGVFKFNYDLGGVILTSVSSYQRFRLDTLVDTDNSVETIAQNPFLNPTRAPAGTPNIIQYAFQDSEAISQELRLTSDSGGAFEYMVGAWYSKVDHERTLDRGPFRFLLSRWSALADNESIAAFGQGTLEFAPETFIDAGLRLNHESISVNFTDYIPNRNNPPSYDGSNPGAPAVTYAGSAKDTAVTGKVALRHFLPSGTMVYGSVSTGYKGQAYDIASGFNQADADTPVGNESSVAYEAGIKGTLDGGSLRYDVTVFRTDYKDYQAQGAVPLAAGGVEFSLNNVGRLRTQGIETNFNWQATRTLNIDFSGAFVDAKIRSFPNAQCYFGQTEAQGCDPATGLQDRSGSRLNNAPRFKFNVGSYWEDSIGNLPFNLFVQGNYQWQDDVNFDLFGQPTNRQDAYGIANFGLGVRDPDGGYSVTLFVNNAFDKLYYTRLDDTSSRRSDGALQITAQRTRESMRYAGIKAEFRF